MKLKMLTAAVLALALPINVLAEVKSVDVNLEKNSFEIKGAIKSKLSGKSVKLIVTNPAYSIDDLNGDDFAKALYLADETKTDENGEYAFSVILADGADSGEYTVYIQDDDTEKPEKFEKYYADDNYKKTVVENINKAGSDTIADMILSAINSLAIDAELVNKIGLEDIAKLVYDYKQKTPLSQDDPKTAAKELKGLMILTAYNKGLSDICFKDGEFQHADSLDFTKTAAYTSYSSILSEAGKSKVREGLLNNSFSNFSDAENKFLELVVTVGVSNPKEEGTGHVALLLTKENAAALGVSFDSYINMSSAVEKKSVETELVKGTYSSAKELAQKLDELVKKYSGSTGGQNKPNGNGSSGGGSSSGSSGNPSSGIVPIEKIDKNLTFDDLESVSWAKEAIEYLYNNNMISGMGDNKFAPQNQITREQFTVMLVNALKLDLEEYSGIFEDVSDGAYYAKHIETAKKHGIINGISEKRFGVGEKITREDMCTMIYRAYFKGNIAENAPEFSDSAEISDYAKDGVSYLAQLKIVNGFENGTFAPKALCTRAQAAKVLYGVLIGK